MTLFTDVVDTPLGRFQLVASELGLQKAAFLSEGTTTLPSRPNIITENAKQQLDAYFAGELKEFELPFDLAEHTAFYQSVWQALLKVPYGETRTYKDQALALGDPNAIRAVGTANGKNPIAIIIPCHRIIGSDGKLVGYAWGVENKRWLLAHERSHSPIPAGQLF